MTPRVSCISPGPDRSQAPDGWRQRRQFHLCLLASQPSDGGDDLVATTVLRCRDLLGRAYLAAVTAIHVFVVQSTLAIAGRH
ncbi:DUF2867 domain-containing protein [Methylobacterium flocculans]|uniref:DUF2867 domain-containing protein n=1 Tax=Methylobacterium flocculans TaxID=2984843 RepID=UPI0021F33E7E|nr:DUF2867 domain-containing protein [Methylobacterium sp. FF17]